MFCLYLEAEIALKQQFMVSMGFAGYVSGCVQLYCVGFHCQHNKAACRQKHNLQNPLNNTVQQDGKIQY
jgi:hypothetical protein